jgi:hypothetical protein
MIKYPQFNLESQPLVLLITSDSLIEFSLKTFKQRVLTFYEEKGRASYFYKAASFVEDFENGAVLKYLESNVEHI